MATLAQYAATLHDTPEARPGRTASAGASTGALRLTGAVIYASVFVLVAFAAVMQAG